MSAPRRGRPAISERGLDRQTILEHAFALLDAEGEKGLTMRDLARRLGVTPMALYRHVGARADLLASMVEETFSGWSAGEGRGSARDRLEQLLSAYCALVLRHPNLTMAIFSDPALYEGAPSDLTERLDSLLMEADVPPRQVATWRNILVDFTHGYALAEAANRSTTASSAYSESLALLFDAMPKRDG